MDSDGDIDYHYRSSLAIDSKDKIHISYYDKTNNDIKYATKDFQSPTPTPSPQPTPTPTVVATPTAAQTPTPIITPTVTPGPTPIPACEPENITADQKNTVVSIDSNAQAAITITCEDGTPLEDKKVAWKIKQGKKNISITPKNATTDANGQALFTITGVKKGRAKVEFTSGDLKVKVKVKVKE